MSMRDQLVSGWIVAALLGASSLAGAESAETAAEESAAPPLGANEGEGNTPPDPAPGAEVAPTVDGAAAPVAGEAPQVAVEAEPGVRVAHVETPPEPRDVLAPADIRGPLVEYETAWSRGVGFLVRDRRTVIVLGSLRDRLRPITCRMASAAAGAAAVRVVRVDLATAENPPFVVLHLESDLPGEPMRLSDEQPEIGDSVFLLLRRGGPRGRDGAGGAMGGRDARVRDVPAGLEPAEAAVTSASETTITVGTAFPQIWHGSPLFDRRGDVVAFFGSEGYAVRVEHLLAEGARRPGRQVVTPILGIRVGTEIEGSLDDPFAVDVEAGVALWDQLAILLRLGVGLGEDVLLRLPPNAMHQTGIVLAEQRSVALSLEVKYRLLLTRAAMPLYLDFVAGLQYGVVVNEPQGFALYATEPACDPFGEDCDLTIGANPGRRTRHGVGPVFGIDVRAGVFTMGYRFVAEAISYQMADTHRLTFGITFR
jgi:hypothetical protein